MKKWFFLFVVGLQHFEVVSADQIFYIYEILLPSD